MNDMNGIDTQSQKRTLWQRITVGRGGPKAPTLVKIALGLVIFAALLGVAAVLYLGVPVDDDPGAAIDFPKELDYGWDAIKWIDGIVDWVIINCDPFFSAVNTAILRGIMGPLEDFLLWIPWWTIIVITGLLAWQTVSFRFAILSAIFVAFMCFMGLIDLASQTLAVTITSTLICIIFGLPLGIIAAKSDRLDGVIRPILDMMQTMPSFVYLIPAVMLFGLGKTPAVMAVCIYAIPPIIRLTSLGIRQVDASVVEAGNAFGATAWQLLRKVQIPLAMPTVLAGLNQTVMMALAMVVIASMIGAQGLGVEVLKGISRLEPGRGLISGISIVCMAIILDRVSQGFAKRPETRLAT